MRRWCALVVLLLIAAQPASAAPARRPRLLFMGDSLLVESAAYLRAEATKAGADVDIEARGGTAICDWLAVAPGVRNRFRPDVVVMAFSGNSLTPCMRDGKGRLPSGSALGVRYYGDLERMTALFPATKPILWVQPPSPPYWNPSTQAVQAAYSDATRWRTDAKVVDGGALISPGGVWSATQPCLYFEACTGPTVDGRPSNIVKAPDHLHFCPIGYVRDQCPVYSSGAFRYATTMLGPALSQAGLR